MKFALATLLLTVSSSAFAIGTSVHLYTEPVEGVYSNSWSATSVNNSNPILVRGEGKTVDFVGLLNVDCDNAVMSNWSYATNFDEPNASVVPAQAIKKIRQLFCK